MVEESVRDLRYGARALALARFTAAALLTLALGIGATSAIFSVVRTVMLEPLLPSTRPYRDDLGNHPRWRPAERDRPLPVEWRERSRTLDHLGMVGPGSRAIVVNGQPLDIQGLTVSSDVFRALGVQPALGRAYTAEEDTGNAVIVLSYEFWQTRLAGRPDILGVTLTTDDGPRTVIGVMPSRFTIVGQKFEFLIPYGQTLDQLRECVGAAAHMRSPGCAKASRSIRRMATCGRSSPTSRKSSRSVTRDGR